jgi:hypothetical protein
MIEIRIDELIHGKDIYKTYTIGGTRQGGHGQGGG